MSDIINILPDSVANQIAAGEVVDRPASAVKEMLENAMDAGATSIQLVVKDAGRTMIQVIDNGCGMSDSDARLCFERHATSKIHQANDLFAIRTMGFRGEALASIAAVAQVELKTRQHDSELGTQVIIEGSDVKEQTPCMCSAGTTITVKNLFYNVPARRNFLKRDSVELAHIEEIFKRVALANYDINFSFHHNGRPLYDLKAGNFAQRIAGIFGKQFNERLYHVEEDSMPVRVNGYIGKAEYVRRTRGEQYIFVNKRFIKHPGLSVAIEKAYSELIPEGTYPSYFFLLDVDPERIDVNIHPTKTEIRFIDEHVIFAILRAATKKALGQFSLASEIEFNPPTDIDFTPMGKDYVVRQPEVSYNPSYNPFSSTTSHTESSHYKPTRAEKKENPFADSMPERQRMEGFFEGSEDRLSGQVTTTPICFLNRYIVTTLKSGVVIIDSERALERILYERMMTRREACNPSAQKLLFPVVVNLCPSDSDLLNELIPELTSIGFEIAPLGHNSFACSAVPPDVNDQDVKPLLEQTIVGYKNNMMQKMANRDNCVCLTVARQAARRDSRPLHPEEMQRIIADLFSCQAPNMSPSGKKTMIILNEQDLTDRFK